MPDIWVVMDCDPGWDDACALAVLLGNRDGRVGCEGITSVYGNRPLDVTTENARRVKQYCGFQAPDLQVYPGREKPLQGDPIPSPALPSRVLAQLPASNEANPPPAYTAAFEMVITAQFRSTIVLATGPLTNVAVAIDSNLDAMQRLHSLVIVGGARAKGASDFNLPCDPLATEKTIQSGLNPVLIPLETCEQVKNGPDLLDALSNMGTPLAKLYWQLVKDQLAQGNPGAGDGLYDVVGALYVLNPDLFSLEQQTVKIEYPDGLIRLDQSGGPVQIAKLTNVNGAYDLVKKSLSRRF